MKDGVLELVIVIPTALVVIAIFAVLWRERRSSRDAFIAIVSGGVLAAWAIAIAVLGRQGAFVPGPQSVIPPVGVTLLVTLGGLALCLASSRSLRRLLSNQPNLIRLNLWRLEGLVFLILMMEGRVPALWALPAGVGDVIVGATAFWIARDVDTRRGRRRAIAFTLFGMADLVVAIALGVMTNPGPTQVFHTTPTAELLVHYPLVLVPGFLVPLAFALHVVSLLQLVKGVRS